MTQNHIKLSSKTLETLAVNAELRKRLEAYTVGWSCCEEQTAALTTPNGPHTIEVTVKDSAYYIQFAFWLMGTAMTLENGVTDGDKTRRGSKTVCQII